MLNAVVQTSYKTIFEVHFKIEIYGSVLESVEHAEPIIDIENVPNFCNKDFKSYSVQMCK